MIRKILFLGALGAAGLTLVACGPSSGVLATAKTGDCFNVTGKDAMGQPKLIHSDCPAGQASGQSTLPPAAEQAAAVTPDAKTETDSTAAPEPALPETVKADDKAVCQAVAPTCVVPAKAVAHATRAKRVTKARSTRAAPARHVWRTRHVARHRQGKTYTETVRDYVPASGEIVATIGAPYSSTELAGGSRREDTYVLRDHPVYAPPPAYAPPPPPAYAPPPPPPVDARRYERSYDSRSSDSRSYSSSQSYSSRSYSSSTAQRAAPLPPRPCNCAPRQAPTYEPDGYLTWPNKSPY